MVRELVKNAVEVVFDFKRSGYTTNNFVVAPALEIVEACAEVVSFGDYRIFMQCARNQEVKEQSLEVLLDRYEGQFSQILENINFVRLLWVGKDYIRPHIFCDDDITRDASIEPYKNFYAVLNNFLEDKTL